MSLDGIKALTFDTFGTVVDWRTSIINDFRAFGQRKGINIDWEAFADEWGTCYRPGMDAVRSGKSPWRTVDFIYRVKLDEILPTYGVNGLPEDEKVYLNCVRHRLNPWPDAVAGLTRLKKKYVVSPLSNGDVSCLVNMAKHGGLPWDVILCAARSHGIRTGFVPRPTEYGPAQKTDLKAEEDWDVIAKDFGELAAGLGA